MCKLRMIILKEYTNFLKENAVAGGIDLAGLFPRYIDIRRVGAQIFL